MHVAFGSEYRPDDKLGKAMGFFVFVGALSSDSFAVVEKDIEGNK